jgi:hypothetical protein
VIQAFVHSNAAPVYISSDGTRLQFEAAFETSNVRGKTR